jgi:hypothetical protein
MAAWYREGPMKSSPFLGDAIQVRHADAFGIWWIFNALRQQRSLTSRPLVFGVAVQ